VDDLNHERSFPEYNTRAVVNRTGVPADTFRAWERRHGLPHPARSQGNHRLYSERDIAIIASLKHMTNEGVSISHAVDKVQRQIQDHQMQPKATDSPAPAFLSALEATRDGLISAISEFDTRRANSVIEDAMAVIDIESLCQGVLEPVLVDIGDRWARGDGSISVEHFGSAFIMRKLSALFNASQPETGEPTIVCSCVEGEHHEIGLMMIALLLSRAGHRVVYLGANLPALNLVSAIHSIRPDAIALSSTTIATLPALIDAVAAVRGEFPSSIGPVIGFGGGLFECEPEHRHAVEADYLGTDARTARVRLDELVDSRTSLTPG
jgi:methanogenic corrinoid protein MtbC1